MITKIEIQNIPSGPIVRQWASLYCQLSTEFLPSRVHGLDRSFVPLLRVLYASQGKDEPGFYDLTPFRFQYRLSGSPGRALVAFTGGKDSTATALALRSQGIDVTLFYVRALNSVSYGSEAKYAARVAQVLDMPLVQYNAIQTGVPELPDNPVKNQYVLALMVEYGQKNGFAYFAQGNLAKERLNETALGFTVTDSLELYEAANDVFNAATFGTYNYLGGVMQYESESFVTIADLCPEVLDVLMSCIMPDRFRNNLRKRNEKKYGVVLRPECCGTCYKCASEYLHRVLMGKSEYVPDYVARCISLLQAAHQKLAGLPTLPEPKESINFFIENKILPVYGISV